MKKKNKKIKPAPKQYPRLWLEYVEDITGGEICAGQENDAWPSHEDTDIEVNFIRLHRDEPKNKFFNHSVEVDERLIGLDRLYLAVVRYSTGDTFGHTEGAWYIVGLAPTYKVAEAMLDVALNDKKSYKPWTGYFERFSGTEIHTLEVV
jgi:hypothetical protein